MNYAESKTPFAFSVILYLSIRLKRKTGKSANGMKRCWITIYLNLATNNIGFWSSDEY